MNAFIKLIEKIGVDNILHFLAGYMIASLGVPFGLTPAIVTFFVAVAFGVLKEVYDQLSYGGFDHKEMLVTAAGASVCLCITLLGLL